MPSGVLRGGDRVGQPVDRARDAMVAAELAEIDAIGGITASA